MRRLFVAAWALTAKAAHYRVEQSARYALQPFSLPPVSPSFSRVFPELLSAADDDDDLLRERFSSAELAARLNDTVSSESSITSSSNSRLDEEELQAEDEYAAGQSGQLLSRRASRSTLFNATRLPKFPPPVRRAKCPRSQGVAAPLPLWSGSIDVDDFVRLSHLDRVHDEDEVRRAKKLLQQLNQPSSPRDAALAYVIEHPAGPLYDEVKIKGPGLNLEHDEETYVELHVVELPADLLSGQNDFCRLTLNVDSGALKLAARVTLLLQELLQLAASMTKAALGKKGEEDSSALEMFIRVDAWLPTVSFTVAGPCEAAMRAQRTFASFISRFATYDNPSDTIMTKSLGAGLREMIKRHVTPPRDLAAILQRMFLEATLTPYITDEDLLQAAKEIGRVHYVGLSRNYLAEAIRNAHLSLVVVAPAATAEGASSNKTQVASVETFRELAGYIGRTTNFRRMPIFDYLAKYRKVEWRRAPESFQFYGEFDGVGNRTAARAALALQIFEDDIIGIKHLPCEVHLALETLAHLLREYVQTAAAVEPAEFSVLVSDVWEDAPFFSLHSASAEASCVKIVASLDTLIADFTKDLSGMSSQQIAAATAQAMNSSALLLNEPGDANAAGVALINFYELMVRNKFYDFSRPAQCLVASKRVTQALILDVAAAFLAPAGELRRRAAFCANNKQVLSPQVLAADRKSFEAAGASLRRTYENRTEVLEFVRSRPLLPATNVVAAVMLHDRHVKQLGIAACSRKASEKSASESKNSADDDQAAAQKSGTIQHAGLLSKVPKCVIGLGLILASFAVYYLARKVKSGRDSGDLSGLPGRR